MKALKKVTSILLCLIVAVFSSFAGAGFYTTLTYSHNEKFSSGYDIVNVIDISDHNGSVDWAKVYADGVHEVILRVGYRGNTEGGIYPDDMFEANYTGAVAAGLKVGVYFYTQAISMSEAKAEADFVINAIKGKNITLPVIYDCEYAESGGGYTGRLYKAHLSKLAQTSICLEFLNTIKAAGYQPMLYANKFMLNDKLYVSSIEASYPIWLAHYVTKTDYTGQYDMWQYTSTGKVDGVKGNVDLNFRYVKKTDVTPVDPNPTDPNPVDPNPTDPNPVDPNPVDPNPVNPNPTEPEPTEPEAPSEPSAEGDIFMMILNMITDFIVWLINALGKLMASM